MAYPLVRIPTQRHPFVPSRWVSTRATIAGPDRHRRRCCWRVRYTLHFGANRGRRAFHTGPKFEASSPQVRLARLEEATRSSIATREEIDQWVRAQYLAAREAAVCFPGWADTQLRDPALTLADYPAILAAHEEFALRRSRARDPLRRAFMVQMARARRVVAWLEETHPMLPTLAASDVDAYRADLEKRYRGWTVHHRLTALRSLLDRAQELGMVRENPARAVRVDSMPKTATVRRILSRDETGRLLDVSLSYRQWVYGGLPTAVRLGLYAGSYQACSPRLSVAQ